MFGSLRSAPELLKVPMCHAPSKYLPAGPFACGGQNAFVARSAPSYITQVPTLVPTLVLLSKISCKLKFGLLSHQMRAAPSAPAPSLS